ncbi:60 kDa inner membrane insertion protein [Catenulispora acidiphila DSM 44928]|uniref:Membrane protein insertase YidC n=1 Tax=Catenulispora acidiphila (strain DSM 44928 / JCM 14897 / NBRC 102108 / NRRL B-24433 / ID139908) TaxID=479433 RepID=C7Q5Q5_CATAD|nr:membrane protein insertase YidC [Catenulispora acidiphila]ACU77866.1 60 kDa inner membrane insertion protein [Catenulispora acidiphila DSM 44928]
MIDTILSPIIWATSFVMMLWHRAFGAIFGSDSSASWVLAIIFLTITIRAAMIPLFRKQIKSMQNMQRLQPQIQALQKKYKLDKQKLQQEMMKLYKDNGTSPFASCMPILLQTPFFMGLYRVLSHVSAGNAVGALSQSDSVSAMHASFFGAPLSLSFLHHTPAQMSRIGVTSVTNLQIIAIIMAIIYATSQFLTQRMMMAKNTNLDNSVPNPMMQSQKIMLYVMPFGMLFFSLNVQIGVVLYLMTTNVWTIGQQFYTLRNSPMPGSQAEKEMFARNKAKEDRKRQDLIAKDPEAAKALAAANGSSTQDKVPVTRQRQQPVRTTRSKRKK